MDLATMTAAIIADIDPTSTIIDDAEAERAVVKATADISRFIPLQKVYEFYTNFDVAGESWTAGAGPGDLVYLDNKFIKPGSEKVYNFIGTLMERGTDYLITYATGAITHILAGSIADDEVCTIDYKKSKIDIMLDDIWDELIRVTNVFIKRPYTPENQLTFGQWGTVLTVFGEESSTQTELPDGQPIVLFYEAAHTGPTDGEGEPPTGTSGTWPPFLDEVVVQNAEYYCLMMMSLYYAGLAGASATSASGLITGAAAGAIASATSANSISTIVTNTGTALGDSATAADESTTQAASAPALINKVNWGSNVPENYSRLAEVLAGATAVAHRSIAESNIGLGQLIVASTARHVDTANAASAAASQLVQTASIYTALSARLRSEANEKRAEAFGIYQDFSQWKPSNVTHSARQPIR